MQIWVSSNPRGAERLAPGIVVPESDLFPRRLYGKPSEVSFFLFLPPKDMFAYSITNIAYANIIFWLGSEWNYSEGHQEQKTRLSWISSLVASRKFYMSHMELSDSKVLEYDNNLHKACKFLLIAICRTSLSFQSILWHLLLVISRCRILMLLLRRSALLSVSYTLSPLPPPLSLFTNLFLFTVFRQLHCPSVSLW